MADSVEKVRRHRMILAILRQKPIASQDELALELESHKVTVTQSTLSRDLKELKVTRAPTDDGYRYLPAGVPANGGVAAGQPERFKEIAALEVMSVEANDVAVAIRTMVGRAQGLGVYLDSLSLPEVLATVAGDDTVIVHPRKTRSTARLRRHLATLLGVA